MWRKGLEENEYESLTPAQIAKKYDVQFDDLGNVMMKEFEIPEGMKITKEDDENTKYSKQRQQLEMFYDKERAKNKEIKLSDNKKELKFSELNPKLSPVGKARNFLNNLIGKFFGKGKLVDFKVEKSKEELLLEAKAKKYKISFDALGNVQMPGFVIPEELRITEDEMKFSKIYDEKQEKQVGMYSEKAKKEMEKAKEEAKKAEEIARKEAKKKKEEEKEKRKEEKRKANAVAEDKRLEAEIDRKTKEYRLKYDINGNLDMPGFDVPKELMITAEEKNNKVTYVNKKLQQIDLYLKFKDKQEQEKRDEEKKRRKEKEEIEKLVNIENPNANKELEPVAQPPINNSPLPMEIIKDGDKTTIKTHDIVKPGDTDSEAAKKLKEVKEARERMLEERRRSNGGGAGFDFGSLIGNKVSGLKDRISGIGGFFEKIFGRKKNEDTEDSNKPKRKYRGIFNRWFGKLDKDEDKSINDTAIIENKKVEPEVVKVKTPEEILSEFKTREELKAYYDSNIKGKMKEEEFNVANFDGENFDDMEVLRSKMQKTMRLNSQSTIDPLTVARSTIDGSNLADSSTGTKGVTPDFFNQAAFKFGRNIKDVNVFDNNAIYSALGSGNELIAGGRGGWFSNKGHYINMRGIGGNNVEVRDPNGTRFVTDIDNLLPGIRNNRGPQYLGQVGGGDGSFDVKKIQEKIAEQKGKNKRFLNSFGGGSIEGELMTDYNIGDSYVNNTMDADSNELLDAVRSLNIKPEMSELITYVKMLVANQNDMVSAFSRYKVNTSGGGASSSNTSNTTQKHSGNIGSNTKLSNPNGNKPGSIKPNPKKNLENAMRIARAEGFA